MSKLNHKDRTISTKIVYYGPALSGKTTNIEVLHEHAGTARRGELISVNTAQDRTIMFDLLPLKVAAFRGIDVKVQLVAVPGQPMYAAIRRLALKDVDALVFVANSAADRQEENVISLNELISNLPARPGDASPLPLVLQYNKRDLPNVAPTEVMDRALNPRQGIAMPAVAIRGEGVLETFSSILALTVMDLARLYRLSDVGSGQTAQAWSAAAVQELFGTSALASVAQATGSGAGRQTVRLTLPPDVGTAARLDARTNEALVVSYAEAAVALGDTVEQVREERDLAQRRLADVLQVLDAARGLKQGDQRDSVHVVVLGCLAREVNASHASWLVPAPNQGMRAAALHGLDRDPILSHAEAMPRLRSFLSPSAPRWHETDNDPALRAILASSQPPHGSVVSVPLAVGQDAPIGVALLYRAPSAPPPRRESLKQLAEMARILAPFLESSHASGGDRDAGARELLGAAFRLAAPRLLHGFRELRQKLTDLRRHPDSPVWLPAALAEIAPTVGELASLGRSLAGLDTGALEDEPVEVGAFLGKFRSGEVQVEIGAGVKMAKVDPALFGLALEALIDRARRQGPGRVVELRCTARDGRVAVRIGVKGPLAPTKGSDPGLGFPAKVVALHGGQLSVEMDAGVGSWVLLDVAAC
jgi:signal recognition particle receptor subunit beta